VGDQIRIQGTTTAGLYFPGVDVASLQIIGHGDPPNAVPASYDDLATGRFHYQRIIVEGLGRTLTALDENRTLLRLAIGSRVLEVRIDAPLETAPALIDARLRITALAAGGINDRRQLVVPYIRVTDWKDVVVMTPAKPFTELPWVSVTNLLRFTGKPDEAAQSVRIHGLVLALFPDGRLYARDQEQPVITPPASAPPGAKPLASAICIRVEIHYSLHPGDHFIAVGFPVMEGFTASLADARLLEITSGAPPEPVEVNLRAFLNGSHDADLVQLNQPVTLRDHFRTSDGYELRLDASGTPLRAFMPHEYFTPGNNGTLGATPTAHFDSEGNLALEKGATLSVSGICQIEASIDKGFRSQPERASLLLRSPGDIRVLSAAPFWSARRLVIASSMLAGLVLLAFIWIAAQRRQISALSSRIMQQATLDERQRIAREFHDTLEQELTGLSLRLDAATTRPLEDKARTLIETSRSLVSRIQSEARNLVADLRDTEQPPELASALRDLQARMPPDAPTLTLDLQPIPPISGPVSHHLRMIAQEAITNAIKHAHATALTLHLSGTPTRLKLCITDNGHGFDPTAATTGKPGHFGCMGIRERARKIGAEVGWESERGKGTSVCISLPLAQ
jgi:signal transduction histidine kinase